MTSFTRRLNTLGVSEYESCRAHTLTVSQGWRAYRYLPES